MTAKPCAKRLTTLILFSNDMPFVTPLEGIPALRKQRKLGRPNMLGWHTLGFSELGDTNIFSAVYQMRRRRLNFWTRLLQLTGNNENFMQKMSWPSNPQTEIQQANRAKFATALLAWQALTLEEKRGYNESAAKENRRGYDVFMSQWLKSH